jgi:hypothetical protein
MVAKIERDKLRLLRDSGVAGRAPELVGERARSNRPGERVFSSAGAEKKDFHARSL